MSRSSIAKFPKENPLVKGLSTLLADTYLLKLKTHNYHWNVEGKDFFGLHQAFMNQYVELEAAADEIAERIRAIGSYAPGSYKQFAAITSVQEVPLPSSEKGMVADLIKAHEALIKQAKQLSAKAAQANDPATQSMVDDRITIHEKTVWMLKSSQQ